MAKDGVEVEIKIPVSKKLFEEIRRFLKKNARFVSSSQEIDSYFNSPHRDFLTLKHPLEYLRVRKRGTSGSFNYKYHHYSREGERLYADEYETKIENPYQLIKILRALNFKKFITVNKRRETYVYKGSFEFALDNVKNLGYFVEIEAKKDIRGCKKTLVELKSLARNLKLNLTKIDNYGYVALLMKKKNLAKKLNA